MLRVGLRIKRLMSLSANTGACESAKPSMLVRCGYSLDMAFCSARLRPS
jgi:hypothetical protein